MSIQFYLPNITDNYVPDEINVMLHAAKHSYPDTPFQTGIISPGDIVPVAAPCKLGFAQVYLMEWGYCDEENSIYEMSAEAAAKSLITYDGFYHRRCLVSASYYFGVGKGKRKFEVWKKSGSRMMYLAGIYRKKNGKPQFMLLMTKTPTSLVPLIGAQMPIIFDWREAWKWVSVDRHEAAAFGMVRNAIKNVAYREVWYY